MTMTDDWISDTQQRITVPRNARLRLTESGLMLVPVTSAHKRTQNEIENQIGTGMPGWRSVGEFSVLPEREGYKPEPDVSAVRAEEYDPKADQFSEEKLPFVIEIVSKESRHRAYETKPIHYARRGIPAYLVVDVQLAAWTLYRDPEGGGYQLREEGVFGEEITLPVDDELTLRLDSRNRGENAGDSRPDRIRTKVPLQRTLGTGQSRSSVEQISMALSS
jgi:Uma2 family endonuclease